MIVTEQILFGEIILQLCHDKERENMPNVFVYLGITLLVICIWFMLLKRPIYEAILVSFFVLVAVTNSWGNLWGYIREGMETSLLYSMLVFIAMSLLLTKTKIIDSAVAIILALLGRVTGGAGYVAVVASAFMGALSGSGAGNVMATGTITIPAMKKSGFPPELAANVESSSSYLGNMIPPSSNIVAALGAFFALYPESDVTTGQFWVVCWGCSLWFVLQRLLMVFGFCKYYKVKPMKKEDCPSLKETLRYGWKGLLLPVIILLPFLLDFLWKESFFTERLGAEGAKGMSGSLLFLVAGVGAIYTVLVSKDREAIRPERMAKLFGESIKNISPVVGTCMFGYMIGAIFADLNLAEGIHAVFGGLEFGRFGVAVVVPLLTCFMGMAIPGSSLAVMFGPVLISLFVSVGVEPLLAAAMLPCICGVMCGITPPLALGMYAGMSIAESDFSKTIKNNLWWVVGHYLLEVVVLMGLLPILGL